MSQTVKIGHATVRVDVEGCIDCGTQFSSGWHPAKTVEAKIGGRKLTLNVSRCAGCERTLRKVKGVCIECGCTEEHACIDEETGQPCAWTDPSQTLCTACA